MSIFKDAANFVNNTGFGGWKLSKPNKYCLCVKNPWAKYDASLTFGFDTNMRNKYMFSVKFRF